MNILAPLKYGADMARSRIRRAPHLSQVFLYLTYRCNLRCIYCDNPAGKTAELSTKEWHSVIEQMAGLGCRRVTVLGGEPLLRPDISEIIQHIRDQGMSCVLTSNGLLVPKMIEELLELNTLVLSLDAAGSANDEVRGEGAFDAVIEAIRAAKKAGIPVKINAVLSAITAPFLQEMLTFVEKYDLGITFNTLRTGSFHLRKRALDIKDSDERIREIHTELAALAKSNHRILFSPHTYRYISHWPDFARERYAARNAPLNDVIVRGGPSCQAGRFYMSIGPQGTAFPCVITAGEINGGNVVKDGIVSCWEKLQIHDCVACSAPCLVELNYLFSLKLPVVFRFMKRFLYRFS
jgi:MoaA/NifB/PqqE/SkfB family radical SAM enzyme